MSNGLHVWEVYSKVASAPRTHTGPHRPPNQVHAVRALPTRTRGDATPHPHQPKRLGRGGGGALPRAPARSTQTSMHKGGAQVWDEEGAGQPPQYA
jgi:hypothetical protein